MEADLEERTSRYEKNASAAYFLIVKTKDGKKEIAIGSYLKDCSQEHLPAYAGERKNLAEKLGIKCDLPTPPFLQYFSSKPLADETIDGKRYNAHPVAEKKMMEKILEELAKLDPSIAGESKPQQLTKIGNRELKGAEFARLKKIYKIFMSA
ncbi:Uncharacterised protein [uncultured archaeon]|nr:Uncharacterised protein [uncultured archaeon]